MQNRSEHRADAHTQTQPQLARRSRGWLLLAGFGLAAVLAWQTSQYTQLSWGAGQRWDVVLDDQHYQLGTAQLQWLEDFSAGHFAADSDELRQQLALQLDARLDMAFAQVVARLPDFADWYYSVGGEYSRLSMTLLGHLNVVDGGYVARRAAEMLFPDPAWEGALLRLDNDATQLMLQQQAQSQSAWLSELQRRLSSNRVPAPIMPTADAAESTLLLDGLVTQIQALQQTAMMDARLTLSTTGAAAVAGPALWRAVSTRAALKGSGAAIAARGAGKVATRTASGAAAGAAVCMPGGPLAVACAAVAAAGTWVATDWLLLQVDEALNRDQLLAGLEEGLAALRVELEAELLLAYEARIDAWQQSANTQIEQTFSPYRAR